MGNSVGCFSSAQEDHLTKKTSNSSSNVKKDPAFFLPSLSSSKKQNNNIDNINKEQLDEDLAEQAIAAAMLFRHHQRNGTLPFPRSSSVSSTSHQGSNKKHSFTKSSSSRQRSLADPLFKPSQLVNQVCLIDCTWKKSSISGYFGFLTLQCYFSINY